MTMEHDEEQGIWTCQDGRKVTSVRWTTIM